MEKRLDVYLVDNNDYDSRNKAQEHIKNGYVSVNNKIITKASFKVNELDKVTIKKDDDEYAGRGAYKLLDAIESFNIILDNKVCLDIGASTGGFSDVCLRNNAKFVYAVDVGHDQLIKRIREDKRVNSIEGINARYLEKDLFEYHLDFICMDVSFISIKKIFDNLVTILDNPYEMVFLIKPQFEAGKANIGKNGIVKDKKVHKQILTDYLSYFAVHNINVCGLKKCSITGKDGNQEYLVYLNSNKKNKIFDIDRIVR